MKLQAWVYGAGLLFLTACGAELSTGNGGGGGSTSTTFVIGSTQWRIEAGSGQGTAIHLMSGDFFSAGAQYQDLVLLGNTGAYAYQNLLPSTNAWRTDFGRIDATAAGSYRFGISLDIDLSSSNTADLLLYSPNQLQIILNNGSNVFTAQAPRAYSNNSLSWMSYAPFRNRSGNNNKFHLLAVSSGTTHGIVQVEDSSFSGAPQPVANSIPSAVRSLAADFNANGYTDFLIVPSDGNVTPIFLQNDEDDNFVETTGTLVRPNTSDISEAILGDFDKDGRIDLLFATDSGFEMHLNRSEEDEDDIVFEHRANIQFSPDPTDVVWMQWGDLTGDANLDLIVARDGDAPILYSGSGNFQFQDITTTAFGTQLDQSFGANSADSIRQVHIVDVDKDGANDVLVMNSDGDITTFFNQAETD